MAQLLSPLWLPSLGATPLPTPAGTWLSSVLLRQDCRRSPGWHSAGHTSWGPSARACPAGGAEPQLGTGWLGRPFLELCPRAPHLPGSRTVAPGGTQDTAAGGCDRPSCVQAPEWGRGPQHPLRAGALGRGGGVGGWEAKSVLPLWGDTGRVGRQDCPPLLTRCLG